jgi:hypothetical protein
MKKPLLLLGLLGLLVASAFGQGNILQAKIPFDFVVNGKTLPAGNYDFSVNDRLVQIKNHDTGNIVALGYLPRIAADKTAQGVPKISFGMKDDKHFIQAIWPAQDDGYLVQKTNGESLHEVAGSQPAGSAR